MHKKILEAALKNSEVNYEGLSEVINSCQEVETAVLLVLGLYEMPKFDESSKAQEAQKGTISVYFERYEPMTDRVYFQRKSNERIHFYYDGSVFTTQEEAIAAHKASKDPKEDPRFGYDFNKSCAYWDVNGKVKTSLDYTSRSNW